jgi:hypothetical protein
MKEFKEISDKSPFRVPDNYFEEVNRKIILATSGSGTEVKNKSLYRKLRPYLAVAASVAVLVVLSYTAIRIISAGKDGSGLPEITLSEFSDNYLYDIDLLTLEESAVTIEPDVAHANIDSKVIIDYLMLENIDINDIYEHL